MATNEQDDEPNEKAPEGGSSYSLRLNNLDYSVIFDTLKDYALKLVANTHSEMTGEQFESWVNEHTTAYANALARHTKEAVKAARSAELDKLLESVSYLYYQDPINKQYEKGYNDCIEVVDALLKREKRLAVPQQSTSPDERGKASPYEPREQQ